jgi:hypothetical protein
MVNGRSRLCLKGREITVIGLDALVRQLPSDIPCAIFIVQHMAPQDTGFALLNRLGRHEAFRCALHGPDPFDMDLDRDGAGWSSTTPRRQRGAQREICGKPFQTFRTAVARLNAHELSGSQRTSIPALENELEQRVLVHLGSLERSDCEEQVAASLERHGVTPRLGIGAGARGRRLRRRVVRRRRPPIPRGGAARIALARMAASLAIGGLLEEIEHSSNRIMELVRAIKEYTYMDQSPEQEVDIHHGLENTQVKLDFDRSLPKICALGSELNQVWTNIIDNAADAMDDKGELRIRTTRELDRVLVEIGDNGLGHPGRNPRSHFRAVLHDEGVGNGTGVGLETRPRYRAGARWRDYGGIRTGKYVLSGAAPDTPLGTSRTHSVQTQ